MRLSDEQKRVLKRIARVGRASPNGCRCSVRTFIALSKRKLIHVETTFESIAFPASAMAIITDLGREAIRKPRP